MMRRKQYDALKKTLMTGPQWCDVLGVIMYDPGGFPSDEAYEKPMALPHFVKWALASSTGSENCSNELLDCANYAAEDGDL